VDELARANRRLAGTLGIVLGTLDSPDVGTLFERTLEQLQQTLDAAGSLVYLCDAAGMHLRGTSASLGEQSIPRFLSMQTTLAHCVADAERVVSLRVLPPSGASLREGPLVVRQVVDEGTHETFEMHASHLPPFVSFVLAPVRFSEQLVAVFVVGWQRARSIAHEDLELLDAVMRYLSVQLVGAFATLNRQRREQLMTSANELRDRLVATTYGEQVPQQVMDAVEKDLGCACVPLELLEDAGPSESGTMAGGESASSSSVCALASHALSDALSEDVRPGVTSLESYPALVASLRSQDLPSQGVLAIADLPEGERLRFLALRHTAGHRHHFGGHAGFFQAYSLFHRDLVERVHGHLDVRNIHARAIALHTHLDVVINHAFDRYQNFQVHAPYDCLSRCIRQASLSGGHRRFGWPSPPRHYVTAAGCLLLDRERKKSFHTLRYGSVR
jgi:GAF domain-containing protein